MAASSLSYKAGVGQKQLVRDEYEIRGDSVGLESASALQGLCCWGCMETRASSPKPSPAGRDNCRGLLMQKLYDRLGLPKTHYRMHQAVLAGLPVSLVADLAHELGLRRTHVARWVGTSFRHSLMSARTGEVFCRLVETLDALLELHEGDLDGALRWLTSPVLSLASERPIDLLITEPGRRAVLQVILALEHGLPA